MSNTKKVQIRRENVTMRLEKRLVEVMKGLAETKGMSIGEMVEEVFLHSFCTVPEKEGQICASPHTAAQLEVVNRLNKSHGVDYDAHDCYAFTEEA